MSARAHEEQLKKHRQMIDCLDQSIMANLGMRRELSKTIGELKHNLGMPVTSLAREDDVLGKVLETAREIGMPDATARKLFTIIIQDCRQVQRSDGPQP